LAPLAEALCAAAKLVARVAGGHSLNAELARDEVAHDVSAQGALNDLCFGTLRGFGRVQAIVEALVRRPASDPVIDALLWCALYALQSKRYAAYTVVDQAVRACVLLEKARAKSFVNAVLRAFLRQQRSLETRLAADPVAHWQHPAWWIERVRTVHPADWQQVLACGNSRPPMCLRVNLRRSSVETYAARLAAAGVAARPLRAAALMLERPMPVRQLPGFSEGDVSVQDAGAQRAATRLDLRAGQRVLDACSAPGGKGAHILETESVALTALELRPTRAAVVAENFARLGLTAEVRAADCTAPDLWWDGRAFDRILADVPCTASGVVRRHPDIKWLRRETDLASYADRQARILRSLWGVLAPGGKLLYVTCSVFREENDALVDAFLAETSTARSLPMPDGEPDRILPSPEEDGFFFALLAKTA